MTDTQKGNLIVRYRRGNPRETVTPVIQDSVEMWRLVREAAADRKVASVRLEVDDGSIDLYEAGRTL